MALSAEEYGDLSQQIPYFDSNPSYRYLAEKRLLPQQRGLDSFENAPLLTSMRRAVFGLTKPEAQLMKQQQDALIPFEQEQEIKNKLKAAFEFQQQTAPTLSQASAVMPSLAGTVQPDQQIRPLTGRMTVPSELVPPTFDIAQLQPDALNSARRDAAYNAYARTASPGEIASGAVTNTIRSGAITPPGVASLVPPERALEVYGAPVLDPAARMNQAQLAAYQSTLAGHLTDAKSALVPPALQASRETPVEVNPGNVLATKQGTPLFHAPGRPDKENEEFKKFTAVLNAAGIDPDGAMGKQLYGEWAKKIATPAPGTQVTTNVSTEKKYGEVFSTKVAEADQSKMDAAEKAPMIAERAGRILGLLKAPNLMTGTGAEFRVQAAKALKLAGLASGDGIEETEALASELSNNTLDAIKASGMGGGTGFSNADRDFLEKAKGGKITLEAGTLRRLALLNHAAAQLSARAWEERVKRIPKSAIEGTGIGTEPITVSPVPIQGDTDWAWLPKGTRFVGPDGKVRVK